MKTIPLTRGYEAIIDDSDCGMVGRHKWSTRICNGVPYASTSINGKTVYLHRLILGVPDGMEGDHINNNTLDNQRHNLRVVTHAQNVQNRKGSTKRSKTGVRGVYLGPDGRYRSQVGVNWRRYHLGVFDTIEEASAAAQEARRQYMTHSEESDGVLADIATARSQSCVNCGKPVGSYRPERIVRYCSATMCRRVQRAAFQLAHRDRYNGYSRAYRARQRAT